MHIKVRRTETRERRLCRADSRRSVVFLSSGIFWFVGIISIPLSGLSLLWIHVQTDQNINVVPEGERKPRMEWLSTFLQTASIGEFLRRFLNVSTQQLHFYCYAYAPTREIAADDFSNSRPLRPFPHFIRSVLFIYGLTTANINVHSLSVSKIST